MADTGTSTALGDHGLGRYLASWSPEPVTSEDALSPGPAAAFGRLLDSGLPSVGKRGELPPLWHWFHFLDWPPQRELGTDGHPARGHFLPPLPARRRMFAGGRARFAEPLLQGVPARRESSLAKVEVKRGRSGELAFVTVRHEVSQEGTLCLVEEQDLVYRSGDGMTNHTEPGAASRTGPGAGGSRTERGSAAWCRELCPSPALLFRYSALTANSHRIHYDAPYARGTEGYPGLVVHGPLLVQLMLELVRENAPGRRPRTLSYQLREPVFLGDEVRALGDPAPDGTAVLRIASARSARHATAEVTFA
ncbi:hypothetical protein ACFY1V_12720 [Streptomyces sp. NPDC001255]|uniref:hypothetical protein n=1 Tax=Streptomyces sp. NPDC001255 TaxID=3364550 RepID=UPI00367A03E9